jgi:hypothetical protein
MLRLRANQQSKSKPKANVKVVRPAVQQMWGRSVEEKLK